MRSRVQTLPEHQIPKWREGADLPTPFRSYIILYCEHSGVARPPTPVHCTGAPLPNGVVLPADQRALLSSKRFCRVLHAAGALSPTNAPVAHAPLSFLFVSFFLPSCAVSLLPPGRAQAASSPQSLPGTVLYRESAGSDALSAGRCSHRPKWRGPSCGTFKPIPATEHPLTPTCNGVG